MDHLVLSPVYEMCLFSTALQWGHCWILEIWSSSFKISSLTAIFPFQTENIQVTLPLEDYLEGKVGFKTYKNYFTAGAGWPLITFLILVNIAAQVNMDIYFGLCPQLGIYIFILYLCYHYFNMYMKIFISKNWLMQLWDLAGWMWNQKGRPEGWNFRQELQS